MNNYEFKTSRTDYKIENVKGMWTVFSVVHFHGKIFKNWVAEATTKSGAETLLNMVKSR